jgi:hypothetical protein
VNGQIGQPGAGWVWRSGNALNIVFVGGLPGAAARKAALEFARKQQARLVSPTPVTRTDTDDRDVSIGRPDLKFPVYWLGRTFDPPGNLPKLELRSAVSQRPQDGPGNEGKIDYEGGVALDLWTLEAWKAFSATRLGRFVWSWPCTKAEEVKLDGGRGVIYAGYAVPQTKPCSGRKPDRYLAHAFFNGVVVAVNMAYCYMCAARGSRDRDPYNSDEGMRAVLEGLRLCEPG